MFLCLFICCQICCLVAMLTHAQELYSLITWQYAVKLSCRHPTSPAEDFLWFHFKKAYIKINWIIWIIKIFQSVYFAWMCVLHECSFKNMSSELNSHSDLATLSHHTKSVHSLSQHIKKLKKEHNISILPKKHWNYVSDSVFHSFACDLEYFDKKWRKKAALGHAVLKTQFHHLSWENLTCYNEWLMW